MLKSTPVGILIIFLLTVFSMFAQIDPERRNLLEVGYDQSMNGLGPQALYAYYYYNNPDFAGTNAALRLAIAPVYFDSELGFRHLLSPLTDVGIGIFGGGFANDYYEVRQGHYYRGQSFDGHGGGVALNVYQLLNPGMVLPINLVASGGVRYATYSKNSHTDNDFEVPDDRFTAFSRTGLRIGGKEPVLYPKLGLELSVWFERQWRLDHGYYGFDNDRRVNPSTDLYWAYLGVNYAWTNIGHEISVAFTIGGSQDADRFSAWRLGGVLPLSSEFPLIIPGYYYEELTARKFVHLYGAYTIPLDPSHCWQLRFEAAAAKLDYLPGFEQQEDWQTGAGCGVIYTPKSQVCRIVLRYGYGFNAIRDGDEGAHSVGVLFQFDLERSKKSNGFFHHLWPKFLSSNGEPDGHSQGGEGARSSPGKLIPH